MATEDQIVQDDPELEITVEGEPVEPLVEGAPKPEASAKPAEDGIEELRANLARSEKQREDEAAARREAEERAAKNERQANDFQNQSLDGQINQLASALESIKHQTDGAKREYVEALQSGDYGKAADVQVKMAELASNKSQIEQGKYQLEQAKRAPPRQTQPQPRQPARVTGDPVEDFVATIDERSPNSKAWIRAHPEYARDASLKMDMLDAANSAVNRGYVPDTPAYFEFVEKKLGITKAAETQAQAEPRRTIAPAAPVSRSTPSLSTAPRARMTVQLTRDEIEMAEASNPSDPKKGVRDWAANKLKMQQQTQH